MADSLDHDRSVRSDRRRSTRYGPYLVSHVHLGPLNLRHPGDNFGHNVRTVRLTFVFDGELTLSTLGVTEVLHPSHAAMAVGWRPLELATPGSALLEVDIALDSTNIALGGDDEGLVVWGPEAVLPSATAAALRELVYHPVKVGDVHTETTRVVEQLILAVVGLRPAPKLPPTVDQMERSRIEEFIAEQHADQHLTPATIADHFRVSTRTLHRLFEGADATVCQLIASERLAAATAALRDPAASSWTIEEVAERSGYGSSLALRRAVLAATGKTPTQLRHDASAGG